MEERNTDDIPDIHIDPEPEFIPAMNHRQKREHIGILARALYPPKIAGLIGWYASSRPEFVDGIFDEIKADAESHRLVVTTDPQGFLIAHKKPIQTLDHD